MKTIPIATVLASIALLTACGGGGSGNNTESAAPSGNSGNGAVNPGSQAAYAYIVQAAMNASSITAGTVYTGGGLLKCTVDANGSLTECGSSGAPTLNNPLSIAFSGSTAYIINQTAPDLEGGTGSGGQYRVLKCTVQTNGSLSGCADTLPGGSLENEFAFKLIANSSGSGYVLKERALLNCPSNFSSKCSTDLNSKVFPATAHASDMIRVGNRLYVVDDGLISNRPSILSFDIDPATGQRSAESKTVTDASFEQALRFDANTIDSPIEIAIKGSHDYIVTRYNNWVVQCSYNSTANTMTACVRTTPLTGLAGITPRNLAIQGNYSYITDSSQTSSENSIIKCSINENSGRFENCIVVAGLAFTTQIADIEFR
jgi:hypothetical protein